MRVSLVWAALLFIPVVGCRAAPDEPVRLLTIATGGTAGAYYPLGGALARLYTDAIPGVTASAQATVASVFNVQAVEQRKVDVAFTQGDVAYLAYTSGTQTIPRPHANLRGMAVLYVNTVQIVARADGAIRRVRDLRGRRVGVGAPGSGTEVAARIIIEAHGLNYGDVKADFLSFAEVAAQLQDRTLDAGFLVASYPVAALTDAATTVGVRLLPIDRDASARIREEYPFFKPVVIPTGTYRGLDRDLTTLGVDNLLVCRADLPDALVYRLTRVFFESLGELGNAHAAARTVDPKQGRSTPIPLHPGAARYYRELELGK
ncbi:MAG: TAXI family TRAP transporter solute-binding subunit [Luteitalea sp.]|nr:TAXI family TRAP transporter solute-binding subunit [Luteitalea sp.]